MADTVKTHDQIVTEIATRLELAESSGDAGKGSGDTASAEKGTAADDADDADDAESEDSEAGDDSDDDSASAGDSDDSGDDSSGTSDDDEDQGADGSAASSDDAEHDDADDDADGDEGAGTDDAEDGAESADPEAAADKVVAADVQALLAKAGLKVTLDDVPKEARPIIQKKLEHANAAITRALQEANTFRKERSTFLAEQEFQKAHPEMAIAELLDGKPELIEKVQSIIDKLEDPDSKRLFATDVKDARAKALDHVTQVDRATEMVYRRADEMEVYLRRACAKLNVPIEIAEEAVANALNAKPKDQVDLTDAEMDAILTRTARVLGTVTRQKKLDTAKAKIRERTKDRRTSTPAVRTGSGVTNPTPGAKRKPMNDAEFTAYMTAKL